MRSQQVPKNRNQQRLPAKPQIASRLAFLTLHRFGERDQLVPMFRATVGTDGRLAIRSLLRCNSFACFLGSAVPIQRLGSIAWGLAPRTTDQGTFVHD